MKKILIILMLFFTSFCAESQIIPKGETKIAVTKKGDTLLVMNIGDARLILSDLLDKRIVDSIARAYQDKDSISTYAIALYKKQIVDLQELSANKTLQFEALQNILANKDTEIKTLNTTITKQKKEIKKQTRLKTIGFTAAVILPLAILLLKF